MGLSVGVTALGLSTGTQTGVGHHTLELLRHLPTPRSEEAYHYLGDLEPDRLPDSYVHHKHRGNTVISRLYNDHYGMGACAESLDLDVLHAPKSSLPFGFSGRMSVTVHDLIFLTHPEYYSLRDRLYWKFSSTISLGRADGIVTVSRSSARAIRQHFAVEDHQVEVIPNGIDPDRFTPETTNTDKEWLEEYDLSEPYYLYLGSDHPRKNLDRLLSAYEQAYYRWSSQLPPLVLAGPTERDRTSLLSPIETQTAGESVRTIGYVDEAALPAVLRGAERLVYPSHAEGFGLPVLQSLSCGTPVACSDLPVLREVAGNRASYFNPSDTDTITAALNPSTGPTVPLTFRDELVEKYRWSTIAERYRTYFRELVQS